MDATTIVLGMIFSSIGLGYFVYGKKQQKAMPFVSGVILMVIPYIGSDVMLILFIAVLAILAPFFIKV